MYIQYKVGDHQARDEITASRRNVSVQNHTFHPKISMVNTPLSPQEE